MKQSLHELSFVLKRKLAHRPTEDVLMKLTIFAQARTI